MPLSALDLADTLFHRLAWAAVGALTCLVLRPGGSLPRTPPLAYAAPQPVTSVPQPVTPAPSPPSLFASRAELAASSPSPARTFTARDVDACARAEATGTYLAPWGIAYLAWLSTPTVDRLALEAAPVGVRVAPHRPRGEPAALGLRAGDWVVAVDGEGAFASSPRALMTKLASGGDSALLVGRGERLAVAVVRACPSPRAPGREPAWIR